MTLRTAIVGRLLPFLVLLPWAEAQQPTFVPQGYVLVDDMILPDAVVFGDSTFTANPWPGGVVFYDFNPNVSASNQVLARQAMDEISAVCGAQFVPHSTTPDWITFTSSTVNNSPVGVIGGNQIINLVSWGTKYIIVHEIMHALGFLHEQSRPDRNNFVTVNAANISTTACPGSNCGGVPGSASCVCNFNIVNTAVTPTPYDFLSIMHYGRTAFTNNGQDTITCNPAFASFQNQIGNRAFLSLSDAAGLQNRYGSSGVAPTITSLSPPIVTTASPGFTLNVYGSGFFGGSPDGNGVQGTKIRWNGSIIPTTFEDSGHLTAQITASMVSDPQQVTISVINPVPGVGFGLGSQILTVNCAVTPFNLAVGVPTTITNGCQQFFINPAYNTFNVVGVSSISDWNIQMGSAQAAAGGNETDFVVGSGFFGSGTVSPTTGNLVKASGFSPSRLEYRTSSPVAIGQPTISSLPAGTNLRAFHFVSAGSGNRTIQVAGSSSLRWKLLWAGNSFSWRSSETQVVASGVAGAAPVTGIGVGPGAYCLVVYKNGSVPTANLDFTISMCFDFTPAPLTSSNTVVTINQGAYACLPFSMTPLAGKWNIIGVSSASDWDLQLGPAVSQQGGNACDYVLADGHAGSVTPVSGICSPYALTASPGELQFGTTTTVGPTLGSQSASAADVIQGFEFQVITPGNYDIRVSATGYLWNLHGPSGSATWRRAIDRIAGPLPSATTFTIPNLSAGWHCIVVYHNGGVGAHGFSHSVLINYSPTQPPVLTSLSPDVAPAGSPTLSLSALGSGFTPSSEVRWNGLPLTTVYVSGTELNATVSSSLLTTPGAATVTVSHPVGGASGGLPFIIGNPIPTVTALNPNFAIAGDPTTTITITGSGFAPGCDARWNGASLVTRFVSTTQVETDVPESLLTASLAVPMDVRNPAPGGGISNVDYLSIYGPVVTNWSPGSVPVQSPGAAATTVTVDGIFFQPNSVVWADGVPLPTTVLSAFQVTAQLDPASLAQMLEPGGLCLNVANTREAVSGNFPFIIGSGSNVGTIRLQPLDPQPGETFTGWIEPETTLQPLTLSIDFGNPAPIPQWPDAATNFVLGVTIGSPNNVPILDGIGFYGPSDGTVIDASGYVFLPGLVMPNPPLGTSATVQAGYLDPSSPLGVTLTWTRRLSL